MTRLASRRRTLSVPWLASSLVLYLVCLAMAVFEPSPGLGAIAVLGLAIWIWQVSTRKKRLSQPPMDEDQALDYVRAHKGRYYAIFAALGVGLLAVGVVALTAGARQNDPMGVVLGGLAIVCAAGAFLFLVRIRHRLNSTDEPT